MFVGAGSSRRGNVTYRVDGHQARRNHDGRRRAVDTRCHHFPVVIRQRATTSDQRVRRASGRTDGRPLIYGTLHRARTAAVFCPTRRSVARPTRIRSPRLRSDEPRNPGPGPVGRQITINPVVDEAEGLMD